MQVYFAEQDRQEREKERQERKKDRSRMQTELDRERAINLQNARMFAMGFGRV
jgi:hypothetical protein